MRKQAWTITKLAIKWRYLAIAWPCERKRTQINVGASSVDFLMYSGYAYMAFMWAQMSFAAHKQLAAGEGDQNFLSPSCTVPSFSLSVFCPVPMLMLKP